MYELRYIGLGISIRKIVFAGVVAALYAGLTIAVMPLSYGPVQIRFSEVLCILPFFFPFSVWGIFIGCIIANILSPYGFLDLVVGSIASLLAAVSTMYIGKMAGRERVTTKAFACFPPVIFNAVLIGAMIAFYMVGTTEAFWMTFVINGLWVGLGQMIVLYLIGLPLMLYLPKTNVLNKLENLYSGGDV